MSKILVIDDERAIRNTLKEVLEYEKHEVDLAEDGPKGLEMFSANTYDIVLCDIKMAKMDGIEVLDKITETSTDIPVIMISGHGNIDTAVEAIKKGAYDFLEKPLDLNRLLIPSEMQWINQHLSPRPRFLRIRSARCMRLSVNLKQLKRLRR